MSQVVKGVIARAKGAPVEAAFEKMHHGDVLRSVVVI